ncbi:PREDICTED: rhox homeobox family member 2B-like [Hipposideros armiger]|uniref:Rhox homeobox family member 2B-like n=1 Tax=Hipposideros armiger TaxID=186990 RepID=A0A8B7QP33_HIPAR|nr:PREDICTED: rhox homeobox family member 2B-like [Hipposideros armiger]
MKPRRQCSQDVTGFLSLGVDEDREKLREAKPEGISLIREGGEEEKGIQPEPEQGATSAVEREIRDEEEAKEGSDGGPGTPGPMDVERHEASRDSGEEPREQGQEEQPFQAIIHGPQSGDRQQVIQHAMFTQVQMQELECIFFRNAYPSLLMRQEIARRMNVSEARVQVWFKKRRSRWRRQQRVLMLRNMRSVALGPHVVETSGRPFSAIRIPQPVWTCVPVPLPLWPPLPLIPPFPPLFLPPPPLLPAPLPPWRPPPCGWAWFLTPNGPFVAPIF